MANFQPQDYTPRRNNFKGKRSQWKRQPLRDIDGNVAMSGMDAAAPSPAKYQKQRHLQQAPNPAPAGQSRRRSRNHNRNRSRSAQNGQINKPSMAPLKAHARVPTHGPTDKQAHQIVRGKRNPLWVPNDNYQTFGMQVASAPVVWTPPQSPQIKHVHMNGVLTPVDNHGDVIMSDAPSLISIQLAEVLAADPSLTMVDVAKALEIMAIRS